MCAVSPVCPEHVHVILVPSSITTGMTVHGGHLLSAQQPFEPLSVPSAHGPACMVRTARRSARRFIERVERGEKRKRSARRRSVVASDEFVVCTWQLNTTLVSNCGRGAALNQSWRALHKRGRLLHGPNSRINKGSRDTRMAAALCFDTSRMGPETAAPHAINAGSEACPDPCVIQRRLKRAHVESAGWQLEMGATGRSTPLLLAI